MQVKPFQKPLTTKYQPHTAQHPSFYIAIQIRSFFPPTYGKVLCKQSLEWRRISLSCKHLCLYLAASLVEGRSRAFLTYCSANKASLVTLVAVVCSFTLVTPVRERFILWSSSALTATWKELEQPVCEAKHVKALQWKHPLSLEQEQQTNKNTHLHTKRNLNQEKAQEALAGMRAGWDLPVADWAPCLEAEEQLARAPAASPVCVTVVDDEETSLCRGESHGKLTSSKLSCSEWLCSDWTPIDGKLLHCWGPKVWFAFIW